MSLDLRQLRHFISVATHGSYARASEALHLTQPTLTRSIQALERQLGAQLLDRGRNGAAPTAIGQELLERGQALLKDAADIERDIGALLGLESGSLVVGAGAYPAEISVGTAAARFAQEHPGVGLDISVDDWSELIQRVLSGELDLAVAEMTEIVHDERFAVDPLPVHRAHFFCRPGHPLELQPGSVTDSDLEDFPLALTSLPPRVATQLAATGGRLAQRIRVDTFSLMRSIVLDSDAVGAAIEPQLRDDLAAGRLVMLTSQLPWLRTAYGVIRRAHRTRSPAVSAFIQILEEVEAEVVAAEKELARP